MSRVLFQKHVAKICENCIHIHTTTLLLLLLLLLFYLFIYFFFKEIRCINRWPYVPRFSGCVPFKTLGTCAMLRPEGVNDIC